MKTTVVTADRLTPEHLGAWSRFQQADPNVESPFFRPEFTQAVAAVRQDVKVAILEEEGEPVGFFPFQRSWWGTGRPVGGRLSDYQGVVARPGVIWQAEELIRSCGLSTWDFDHLVMAQSPFKDYHWKTADSPYMDLSEGFEAYRAGVDSDWLTQTSRKSRKIQREIGPLRFEVGTTDREVFTRLVEWKSEQYRRTRATNVFSFGWTIALLERILAERAEAFMGFLSALYVGDRLISIDFSLRSHGVLHSWFAAYDRTLSNYSPGLILILELAKVAQSLGIRRIDLGKGDQLYKTRVMSGTIPLAEGSVAIRPWARMVRGGWFSFREWVRSSRLRRPIQMLGKCLRPLRGWLAFR